VTPKQKRKSHVNYGKMNEHLQKSLAELIGPLPTDPAAEVLVRELGLH